ncbi:hypothetical protein BOX15_Mlig032098g1 [Macrostomum lignano]|uniref:Uncharacterized protein n=1 Tax=Macrostomum lignano TaxID=282301 RepID=A0A267FB27_9PLAT|nr:hypothetical protein BOX15_Mlig032098g1 [Macrostomum lignano]
MSSDANATQCSIRACNKPIHDEGPRTGVSLCRVHFDKEVLKLTEQKDILMKKLRALRDFSDTSQLRVEQSALATEIEDVREMFDELEEELRQWRQRTEARVQAVHDSVADHLRDASEAEQCEKDLTAASEAGDVREMAKLAATTELWLEDASERSAKFNETRLKLRERQSSVSHGLSSDVDVVVRSVGDVVAGVQQLKLVINKHMASVMQQCWLEDGDGQTSTNRSMTTIDELEDQPCLLCCCSNTAGFVSDSAGRIVRAGQSSSGTKPLPQPSIFISFNEKKVDYLQVVSLDGTERLEYHSKLNWREFITGLHCDNEKQMLFVSQYRSVTVSDLSGEITRIITAESLGLSALGVHAICGNMDKLFVSNMNLKGVNLVSKKSGNLESSLDVSHLGDNLDEIALHGSKILLVDNSLGKIRKICSINGQLISGYPAEADSRLIRPVQVAVDSRGVLFVTDAVNNTVCAFLCSGELLQTFGGIRQEESFFSKPFGLIVVQSESGELLVVADCHNSCLRVFPLD